MRKRNLTKGPQYFLKAAVNYNKKLEYDHEKDKKNDQKRKFSPDQKNKSNYPDEKVRDVLYKKQLVLQRNGTKKIELIKQEKGQKEKPIKDYRIYPQQGDNQAVFSTPEDQKDTMEHIKSSPESLKQIYTGGKYKDIQGYDDRQSNYKRSQSFDSQTHKQNQQKINRIADEFLDDKSSISKVKENNTDPKNENNNKQTVLDIINRKNLMQKSIQKEITLKLEKSTEKQKKDDYQHCQDEFKKSEKYSKEQKIHSEENYQHQSLVEKESMDKKEREKRKKDKEAKESKKIRKIEQKERQKIQQQFQNSLEKSIYNSKKSQSSVLEQLKEKHEKYCFEKFIKPKQSLSIIEKDLSIEKSSSIESGEISDYHDEIVDEQAQIDKFQINPKWPWIRKDLSQLKNPLQRLNQEIIDFVKYIQPSEEEDQERINSIENLKNLIQEEIPDCDLKAYGSFETKFYLPNSDVDVVVVKQIEYTTQQEQDRIERHIYNKVAKILKESYQYEQLELIQNAKVPIIKFTEKSTKIQYDLSFNKLDGVKQLNEVRKALQIYPQLKYLLFVVKYFLRERNLHETYFGGIGSFLCFCMIIAFLRETKREKECQEQDDSDLNQESLVGEYFLRFLEFYGKKNDWKKYQILMGEGGQLKMKQGSQIFTNPHFSLISPYNQNEDLGRKSKKIKEIFAIFREKYEFLTSSKFDPNESILKYFFQQPKDSHFPIQRKNFQ